MYFSFGFWTPGISITQDACEEFRVCDPQPNLRISGELILESEF